MIEKKLLTKEEVISIMEGYNNQSTIVKVPKVELSKDTYDAMIAENPIPLSLIAEEVEINPQVENDKILVSIDNDDNLQYTATKKSKYTKKKYVYKKKNKGSRKNRKMRNK